MPKTDITPHVLHKRRSVKRRFDAVFGIAFVTHPLDRIPPLFRIFDPRAHTVGDI